MSEVRTRLGGRAGEPSLLYRPPDAWVGDVIPFFGEGAFHAFYIVDDRDARGAWQGLAWNHLVSEDLVAFRELPVAIPHGTPDELDLIVGTGSVDVDPDGGYVAYYAGINPSNPTRGRPEQVVLRTTSPDLVTWTKDRDFILEADERWYERHDWRDPYILRGTDGQWHMILCARVTDGPSDRRGTFGLATSTDRRTWTVRPPMLTPGTTRAPECPDLFPMDGRWHLVYAGYSDRFATRYLVADAQDGPWRTPTWDALEAPDVYAMKTVSDGHRRYLMGWLATRSGDRDTGHRQWGGHLLVHELVARPDGTLGARPVQALLDRFRMTPAQPGRGLGGWTTDGDAHVFDGDGLGWLPMGPMASTCLLDVTVDLTSDVDELAIVLRADEGLEDGYHLRLEPRRGRFVFDRRPHHITIPFDLEADRAYVDAPDHEIERPLDVSSGRAHVRVIADGSAIVAYVNDVALSTRGYDLTGGVWGLLAVGGRVRFGGMRIGLPADASGEPV
jgi:beta-fructofuranosidase